MESKILLVILRFESQAILMAAPSRLVEHTILVPEPFRCKMGNEGGEGGRPAAATGRLEKAYREES
jgi:hypothetical protein